MLSRVRLSILLAGIFMVSSVFSQAQDRVRGSVLVLSRDKCCKDTAWMRGEEALLEEFETLDVRLQTLELPGEITGDIEQALLEYAGRYETDVVLMITGAPPKDFRADILIKAKNGKISFRRMRFEGEKKEQPLATLTLRVTEAVRAELIPVQPPPSPKLVTEKKAVLEKPPLQEEPEPERARLSLGIGAGVAWSPGGVGPSLALTGSAWVRLFSSLHLEADGSWGFLTRDLETDDGAASFATLLFRGSLFWEFQLWRSVHPALGLGAGAVVVSTGGKSGGAGSTQEDRDTVTYLGIASRTRFEIIGPLGALLAFKAGMLLPRVDVYFGSERVASYGLPLLEGSILLDWRLF